MIPGSLGKVVLGEAAAVALPQAAAVKAKKGRRKLPLACPIARSFESAGLSAVAQAGIVQRSSQVETSV
jgi:hypothetical protein